MSTNGESIEHSLKCNTQHKQTDRGPPAVKNKCPPLRESTHVSISLTNWRLNKSCTESAKQ
uniref:Uncharacterized protein n=1 Tax=Anabas testudineus TaxID=64144 RepID=A0A3Q1IA85_ANATE